MPQTTPATPYPTRQTIHEHAAYHRRAAAGDLEAAARYEALATQATDNAQRHAAFVVEHGSDWIDLSIDGLTPEQSALARAADYRARAVVCRESAAAHAQAINDRLSGKKRKSA